MSLRHVEDSIKIILVLAKSYEDFKRHIKQMGLSGERLRHSPSSVTVGDVKYSYIASPDHIRGYRGVTVEFWDGWETNRTVEEILEIKDRARLAELK